MVEGRRGRLGSEPECCSAAFTRNRRSRATTHYDEREL